MKIIMIISVVVLLVIPVNTYSQNNDTIEVEILDCGGKREHKKGDPYVSVSKMPEFPGGFIALRKFIAENLKYHQNACISGTVYLRFVVLENGEIGEVQLLRGVDVLLDKEAIRVIKLLPKFIPGEQNGKKVKVWFSVPVKFM